MKPVRRARDNEVSAMIDPIIDLKNDQPLYQQLVDHIKAQINASVWQQGMKIPSENELARTLGVSAGTVKKALSVLVHEGILFRRQGQGTFVAVPDFSRSFTRFFRYGLTGDEDPETPGCRILLLERVAADQEIGQVLNLEPGSALIRIHRIRTLKDIPFVVEDLYVPANRFTGIEQEDLNDKLLYPIYSQTYGSPVLWAEEFMQPDTAEPAAAEALQITSGSPVICIRRIAYSHGDQPIEYRKSIGRGDIFSYHIVIG